MLMQLVSVFVIKIVAECWVLVPCIDVVVLVVHGCGLVVVDVVSKQACSPLPLHF